ncbi:unnamed protein product [Closterium sp. Naga37s-1]|nr:unnamed protein product [Closterium sp. Naga37s-1]
MAESHALPGASLPLAELWDYDDVAVENSQKHPVSSASFLSAFPLNHAPPALLRACIAHLTPSPPLLPNASRWTPALFSARLQFSPRALLLRTSVPPYLSAPAYPHPASDTLWSEKVAQVLSLPATAAKSALPLKSHSSKAASAAQWASPETPQPPPHAAQQRGATESEAQRVYADTGVCFASNVAPLLPFSPVLLAPPVAPSPGSASPGRPSPALHHLISGSPQNGYNRVRRHCRHHLRTDDKKSSCARNTNNPTSGSGCCHGKNLVLPRLGMRHGEEQEQHRHSHLPLIVPKGSWKEVYRGLVELDREWKVPPQLPLQAVGSSSEEEGWGAEWTLRDDFFWFSQPFPRLQEARESLTFRLDLPLCLVTGVEIVSGQDIWNAVCPNFLQAPLSPPNPTPPSSPFEYLCTRSKWGSPLPPSPSPPPPSRCPPRPSPTCSASLHPRSPWATTCACCSQAPPGRKVGRKPEGKAGGKAEGGAMTGDGGKGVQEGGVKGGERGRKGKVNVKVLAMMAA